MDKKIVVIGGGPGGYAAALKAAQLGARVTLAEAGQVGGTCLNVGCIPTKTLLHSAEFYRKAAANAVAGVHIAGVSLDWPAALRHKADVVGRLTGGVSALLRHNGVTVCRETASLLSGLKVRIGSEITGADDVILATGSAGAELPVPGADLPGVTGSTGALAFEEAPASLVVAGGGVIGVEFAALYSALGTKVTIVELLPEILPAVDAEIASLAREALESRGVEIYTGAKLAGIERAKAGKTALKHNSAAKAGGGLAVAFDQNGTALRVAAEKVLIAVGRRPNTAGLGLEELGVKMTRGAIETDAYFRTNVPGIYAVGDCNGQMMLAHAAMAQGVAAAGHIMGETPRYNPKIIPNCVYSSPELACVGMTEQQVKDAGIPYSVGRFSLSGNAKALIEGAEGGLIKIVADKKLGEVLGVHMLGPRVTELIAEAALCMSMEGTVEDIANTIHAHPTVGEAVCEAAMAVFGKPIHGI